MENADTGRGGRLLNHWKLLRRRGDPRYDVLDFRNEAISQLHIAGSVPIARFDQLSPCSGAEDD